MIRASNPFENHTLGRLLLEKVDIHAACSYDIFNTHVRKLIYAPKLPYYIYFAGSGVYFLYCDIPAFRIKRRVELGPLCIHASKI
jgi:hypothetical protein